MKKILCFCLILSFFPVLALAQDSSFNIATGTSPEMFEAKVIEILGQRQVARSDGSTAIQQDIKLRGLFGKWQDKEVIYKGIGELDVISRNVYQVNDRVQVMFSPDVEGNEVYYITDFVRHNKIWWLMLVFSLSIIVIGRLKGFKSLLSLLITFIVILYFIIPKILSGSSPIFITIIGSLIILLIVIYLTEGFKRASHLSILSIFISLVLTGFLAVIFSAVTRLSGVAQEEIMYLVGAGKGIINFKGLLLAGIIIGTLGVLDDVVISQIASVEELKRANSDLTNAQVFKKAMKIGIAHIGSMTNTLFLAYAGASLPLLLVFSLKQEPFSTFTQILDNEMIATEIVRAFVGSIGLALAVPISTALAAKYLIIKNSPK